MELERVSAVIRPRVSWEAIELGFQLVRREARAVYGAWALVVWPIFAVIWAIFGRWPWVALLLLWWIRPLLDRLPLFVLSRALFGAAPSPRETARASWGLLRGGWLSALLWRRLDPLRSLLLPVGQLEALDAAEIPARRRVLNRGSLGSGIWLLALCLGMEAVLTIAGLGLVLLFLPDDPEGSGFDRIGAWWDGTGYAWLGPLIALAQALAVTAVEPLYVGGGFALYLNRRTELEGWDIELAFRRLAARLAAGAQTLALGLALVLPWSAWAQSGLDTAAPAPEAVEAAAVPAPPPRPGSPAQIIGEVLARPEFPHEVPREVWRLRWRWEEAEAEGCGGAPLGAPLSAGLGLGVRAALVAVALALLVLVLRAVDWGKVAAEVGERRLPPEQRFGLDLRPASLPADVAGEAWRLWGAGEPVAALGLLYRGALVRLTHHDGLLLDEGATERDCLALALPLLQPPAGQTFTALTRAWQQAAYAHRPPGDQAMRALCDAYAAHLAVRP